MRFKHIFKISSYDEFASQRPGVTRYKNYLVSHLATDKLFELRSLRLTTLKANGEATPILNPPRTTSHIM